MTDGRGVVSGRGISVRRAAVGVHTRIATVVVANQRAGSAIDHITACAATGAVVTRRAVTIAAVQRTTSRVGVQGEA